MTDKKNRLKRTFLYYLLSFLSTLISFLGYIGVKLSIVLVAIGIALLSEKYIGDWGMLVGWPIGLLFGGILLFGLQRLSPYLEKLEDYTNSHKSYPYTEKYGKNYSQPKTEDFGITQTEFNEYNNRFQFDFIKLIFTYGLWIAGCIFVVQQKIENKNAIFLIGGIGMTAILLNYLFDFWNKKISQKHRHYEKIHKFQQAINIYFRIRDENSNF